MSNEQQYRRPAKPAGAYSLCAECKKVEIPEPQRCCSGHECGCYGMPIDPPYCQSCEDLLLRGVMS